MDSHRATVYDCIITKHSYLKSFVDTEPRTLKSQNVPLALPKLVISLLSGVF